MTDTSDTNDARRTHDSSSADSADSFDSSLSLGEFEFECGEEIPELNVAYETYGEFTGDNAILVCHALTGSHHVTGAADGQGEGWWDQIVGPGKAIDTHEQFVVAANVPGSCYGTTGPASTNPETGEPYGSDFPAVTVGDWTRVQKRLLDELGIDGLRAVVGGSVGRHEHPRMGEAIPRDGRARGSGRHRCPSGPATRRPLRRRTSGNHLRPRVAGRRLLSRPPGHGTGPRPATRSHHVPLEGLDGREVR